MNGYFDFCEYKGMQIIYFIINLMTILDSNANWTALVSTGSLDFELILYWSMWSNQWIVIWYMKSN